MKISARFNGPAGSGNGGITCGLLAAHVDADVVEVTLRQPPPLEVELRVADGELYDGELLVAKAVPGTVDVTPPAPVTVAQARTASASFAGLHVHPFPTCFVCGTERSDGLGLHAGPVADGVVACTWTPEEATEVFVWAALDCPGGWSADLPGRPMVLGRMALRLDALPEAGTEHVVQGWLVGGEGRKVHTGSALYTPAGELLAVAQATWITIS